MVLKKSGSLEVSHGRRNYRSHFWLYGCEHQTITHQFHFFGWQRNLVTCCWKQNDGIDKRLTSVCKQFICSLPWYFLLSLNFFWRNPVSEKEEHIYSSTWNSISTVLQLLTNSNLHYTEHGFLGWYQTTLDLLSHPFRDTSLSKQGT